MIYTAEPLPALAPFVTSIGYQQADFPHAGERAVPTGGMQLLVNLRDDHLHTYDDGGVQRCSGAAVQGAWAGPSVIDPAEQRAVLWVAFRPGGAYPFFPAPADALRGQLAPLAELWGRDGAVLRERLLAAGSPEEMLRTVQQALVARAARPLEPDPAIAAATARLHRGRPVAEVADGLGWTPRGLFRRFTAQVGLSPKRFARVRRLQRLLRLAGPSGDRDWARFAAEAGYTDQAHMIHDFRAIAGMRPGEYAPRSPAELNHVPIPTSG